MSTEAQLRSADLMLNAGQSDESTEILAGVSLLEIIGLRARQAAAPSDRSSLVKLGDLLQQGGPQ